MRIFFLTSSLVMGGAQRVATTLCNEWARRGDKITLIATFSGGGKPFYPTVPEVEVLYLADLVKIGKKNPWNSVRRLLGLRRLIKQERPDVIISFLPNVNVAAVVSSAFLGVPVIISERSDPTARSLSFFWRMSCRLAYRFADLLVVQTDSLERKIGRIYPGLRNIRTIPNPLPAGLLGFKTKQCEGRKTLLSLGRLSPEKQVGMVVSAFAKIHSRCADWDLHIYGDGSSVAELEKQVASLGLQNRVYLKGRTDCPWEVMAAADAFVMTSRYEGFPNALLEAMGIGLPCVVFDCPSGPREISRNGEDAILIPLNDQDELEASLLRVMSDHDLRASLGRRAREMVISRFNLSAVINQWDEAFVEAGAF